MPTTNTTSRRPPVSGTSAQQAPSRRRANESSNGDDATHGLPLASLSVSYEGSSVPLLRAAISEGNAISPARYKANQPSTILNPKGILTGSLLAFVLKSTVGTLLHEVAGHSIIGHGLTVDLHGRPIVYWTDVVRNAAHQHLLRVPDNLRFWQADVVDNVMIYGPLQGVVRTLFSSPPAPNDPGFGWFDQGNPALEAVARHFSAIALPLFESSEGFVVSPELHPRELSGIGKRMGTVGSHAWIDAAGSFPDYAMVQTALLMAHHIGPAHPALATALNWFAGQYHVFNVQGAEHDINRLSARVTKGGTSCNITYYMVTALAATLPALIHLALASSNGVNRRLVSKAKALQIYIEGASRDVTRAAKLDELLGAYPERDHFTGDTDVRFFDFLLQMQRLNAYLQTALEPELEVIARAAENEWLAAPPTGLASTTQRVMRTGKWAAAAASLAGVVISSDHPYAGVTVAAIPALLACAIGEGLSKAAGRQRIRFENEDPEALLNRVSAPFETAKLLLHDIL